MKCPTKKTVTLVKRTLATGVTLGIGLLLTFINIAGDKTGDRRMQLMTSEDQPSHDDLKQGDIIFQVSRSSQSKAIQLATSSDYSHIGMVFIREGRPYVYEAVQPVKLTPLSTWIDRGTDNHYVVKRLKNADQILTTASLAKMKAVAELYMGKPYDIYFEWSDDRIYCSELVWKVYHQSLGIEVGQLQALSTFDLSSPPVKALMKERHKDRISLDELVISPAAMFESDVLETVLAR